MCCYHRNDWTEEFLKNNKGKKEIIVYKVYENLNNELVTPFMCKKFKPGLIKSNSTGKRCKVDQKIIYRGIHVFLSRKDCKCCIEDIYSGRNRIIVPVTVKLSELISVGGFDSRDSDRCAVFKSVYLAEADYNRALKKVK
jgi:hypothetical protein